MATAVVCRGARCTIEYAVRRNGTVPARDFIEQELTVPERARLFALFQYLADSGRNTNPQQFKKLEGRLWEFKRHQIRVACFQDGNRWILVSGFRKKEDRWRKSEIERAHGIMEEHLHREAQQGGGAHG